MGCRVRVHRVELAPHERSPLVPEDTARVPFESWVNGWLLDDGVRLGEQARVRTAAGRIVHGTLLELDPGYTHTFGAPPPGLLAASERARSLVFSETGR